MTDTETTGADGGVYTLAIEVPDTRTIDVGALGTLTFERGWYAYTGSAHGAGGFARVERHRKLACGDRDGSHWHVDYLLADKRSTLLGVGKTPGSDQECATAKAMTGTPVSEFGASDCDCPGHLHAVTDRETLLDGITTVHDTYVRIGE
jgi:Uri superfamily endonuclease